VIPTHNPDRKRLSETLNALANQDLPKNQWELVIVDNASHDPNLVSSFDRGGLPNSRIVCEPKPGLTHARLRGIEEATHSLLVFVDDDNVLDAQYLRRAQDFARQHRDVGVFGGRSLPRFESEPEPWVRHFDASLALRDIGDRTLFAPPFDGPPTRTYPSCAPIGAGMVIWRSAAEHYVTRIKSAAIPISDRKGGSLSSGGDNALVLTVLENGWGVAYVPELRLEHLIPEGRTGRDYLARLNRASSRSWIAVLRAHDICPWKRVPQWSVRLRIVKAYFKEKAWKGPVEYVSWQGRCGLIEGLADP
jgi:glycosyltransferase involved in cell wall biosynthesis